MTLDRAALEALFPSLRSARFDVTSPPDHRYNCIAHAATDATRWWEPVALGGYYWPPGVPRAMTLASYQAAFESLGYTRCVSGGLERGVERVAIYVDGQGTPTHAARQLPSGAWTSKLGKEVDIEHADPVSVAGAHYGSVAVYLRRRENRPGLRGVLDRLRDKLRRE